MRGALQQSLWRTTLMAILHLLFGLMATLIFLVPGIAAALNWDPAPQDEKSPLPHLLYALGWGFGLVPFLAFSYAVILYRPLDLPVLATTSLLVTGVFAVLWCRKGRRVPEGLREGWKGILPLLAAAAGVALVYLLKYDSSVYTPESCVHRALMHILHVAESPVDLLYTSIEDQRLGNTAVIGSFVVLYRGLGFQVLYAFLGFVISVGGYLLGRRLFAARGWAWFVALALPLNPYVARLPLLDENLLTLGYASLFLSFLFLRRVPWLYVGAIFGLTAMMRHVYILCIPAILWIIFTQDRDRLRSFLWFFVTFNVITAVGHVHHALALGSVFTFESLNQIGPFSHRFLGDYNGLLQWPFAWELVRTTWNPFPTFLMWPVYMAGHLGLLLWAALLTGVVSLVLRRRRDGLFWLLWFLPVYCAMSVQENWDVPNKMGVIYIIFHPLILWSAEGLRSALRSPWRWGPALVCAVLVSWAGFLWLSDLHVPADGRYYEAWKLERKEDMDYVRQERLRVTRIMPWPDYSRLSEASPMLRLRKLTLLHDLLRDPYLRTAATPYGWFEGEQVDRDGEPLVISIDLSRPPFNRKDRWISVSDPGEADVDLTVAGRPMVVPNLSLPWSDGPVTLFTSRGGANVGAVLLGKDEWRDTPGHRAFLNEEYDPTNMIFLGWEFDEMLYAVPVAAEGQQVRLRLYPGPFSFFEALNNPGQVYLHWTVRVDRGGLLDIHGPYRVFHN